MIPVEKFPPLFDAFVSESYSLTDTSMESYKKYVQTTRGKDTLKIVTLLAFRGQRGATCGEMKQIFGDEVRHSSISGCLSGLEHDDRVIMRLCTQRLSPDPPFRRHWVYFSNPRRVQSRILPKSRKVDVKQVYNLCSFLLERGLWRDGDWDSWRRVFEILEMRPPKKHGGFEGMVNDYLRDYNLLSLEEQYKSSTKPGDLSPAFVSDTDQFWELWEGLNAEDQKKSRSA